MSAITNVIIGLAGLLIYVLQIALLIRAILSWVPNAEESRFSAFIYTVTEPIIIPFRLLFEKFGWFRRSMLDVPFFAAMITLMILSFIIELL